MSASNVNSRKVVAVRRVTAMLGGTPNRFSLLMSGDEGDYVAGFPLILESAIMNCLSHMVYYYVDAGVGCRCRTRDILVSRRYYLMMALERKRFSSRREEVVEYAFQAREAIRMGGDNIDLVLILRSCATIASRLKKTEDEEWINYELLGYGQGTKVPPYRNLDCYYELNGTVQKESRSFEIFLGVGLLTDAVGKGETIKMEVDSHIIALVSASMMKGVMFSTTERCRIFLDGVIADVQYAGTVEYLMDEIRRNVDKKIGELDKTISEELESIPGNLSSHNSTDWTKVGHSCRRVLRFVADEVFPARKEDYTMKDNTTILKVGPEEFVNRLCAFIDGKTSGDARKFVVAEMNYLKDYIDRVAELAQKDEHGKKIEKIDANMAAIHTYLVISEVLKFKG